MSDDAQSVKRRVVTKRRVVGALVVLSLIAVGAAAVLAVHQRPRRQTFFTDAETIRVAAEATLPRDILWQPPAPLAELVNTQEEDYEPRLSWDGLTLFFVRGQAGENADIYISRRTVSGWTEATPLDQVNSAYDDLGPEPSRDGRALYFYSDRPGGSGGYDLWVARRCDETWQPPTNLGPAVNSEFNDYGPALTPDGGAIFFASNRPQPLDSRQPNPDAWPATVREDLFYRTYDLYQAPLTERGPGQAQAMAALNSPFNEGAPCVTPTGDFLYFSSDRPGGEGGFDLYRSWRVRDEFKPPMSLGPQVNSAANELDPGLAALGYALYFSSDRPAERLHADRPNDYNLYYTSSREVFAETESNAPPPIDWAALWRAIGPNLLWALLALLLALWLLRGGLRGRRLSLLMRCLFASLAAHLLLMMLLNFWQVTAGVVDALRGRGEIRVALLPSAQAGEIATQVRGQLTAFELPKPASPELSRHGSDALVDQPTPQAALPIESAAPADEMLDTEVALQEARQPAPAPPPAPRRDAA